MKRLWIASDLNFFRAELGLPAAAPAQRPIAREDRIPLVRNQPAAPAGKTITVQIFDNRPTAEEGIQIMMNQHPNTSFILFEAITFFEAVPATPLRKCWNENGELTLKT